MLNMKNIIENKNAINFNCCYIHNIYVCLHTAILFPSYFFLYFIVNIFPSFFRLTFLFFIYFIFYFQHRGSSHLAFFNFRLLNKCWAFFVLFVVYFILSAKKKCLYIIFIYARFNSLLLFQKEFNFVFCCFFLFSFMDIDLNAY